MRPRSPRVRWVVLVAVTFATTACSSASSTTDVSQPVNETSPTLAPTITQGGPLAEIPADARVSDGGGEPRSAAYWIVWSSCGEGSQAAVAEANGGRDAGWLILDDILADPGVSLGTSPIAACDEAVTLLATTDAAAPAADPVDALAAEVLAAQVNVSAGSESCTAVDGALAVGSTLLTELRFSGIGDHRPVESQLSAAVEETHEVLTAYNRGELCT